MTTIGRTFDRPQQQPADLVGMVAKRPAGDAVDHPIGAGQQRGQQRRLARIEPLDTLDIFAALRRCLRGHGRRA